MSQEITELAAQLERAVRVLRRVEWGAVVTNSKTGFKTATCPACGGIQPGTYGVPDAGHKPGCELASAITEGDVQS